MRIRKTGDGWMIHVPDEVVFALELQNEQQVTIRPVPKSEDEVKHWFDELRGRLPDYEFDRAGWKS